MSDDNENYVRLKKYKIRKDVLKENRIYTELGD